MLRIWVFRSWGLPLTMAGAADWLFLFGTWDLRDMVRLLYLFGIVQQSAHIVD
jgi:hypothetical protein